MFINKFFRIARAGVLVTFACLVVASTCVAQAQQASPKDREIDRKADELLKRLTLEEKIGQVSQCFHFGNSKAFDQRVIDGQIGSIADELDPTQPDRLKHLAVDQSRLHIPLIFGADVIHGYRVMFPMPLGMAASWDMAMIEDAQRRAALEARAAGQSWTYAPMVDIARDPRWGRIVEGAGEDPYLGAKIAVAQVKGFQGNGDEKHLVATMK